MSKFSLKDLNITKKQKKLLILGSIAVIVLVILVICFWPYLKQLREPSTQERFENWVRSFGPWGVAVLIGVQVIQIIIVFIPGEIVELVAGLLYGTFGGLLICLIGLIIATMIVYFFHYLFGRKFTKKVVDDETMHKFQKSSIKSEVMIFFALLLPGIPKDIFTYIAPICKIPMIRFIFISIIARLPNIISSTLMGSSIIHGKFNVSVLVMILSSIISILGFIFNKKIIAFLEKKGKKNINSES